MSKDPGKDMLGKKSQYYVEYLGWRACRGLEGREFTEPIVQELLRRRHSGPLPKLTIQVSRKEIKVSREVTEDSKKKKIKTIKYPSIPSRDVSFAIQALEPDTDIVSCIYLGFNPKTSSYTHVHVYRCDSPMTAKTFVQHLSQILNIPEHRRRLEKIERDLISRNVIDIPQSMEVTQLAHGRFPQNGGGRHPVAGFYDSSGSNDRSPPGSDDLDADLVSLKDVMPFDAIADELKQRLNVKAAPLLLPPADYDTVSRARGNLDEAQKRKSRNPIIVGSSGLANPTGDSVGAENPQSASDEVVNHEFPSEGFYLYPPRSPRDYPGEPSSPRVNLYRDGDLLGSPRSPRQGIVPMHGRQHSSSSTHSNGSGSHPSNVGYESRDRLSGYSNSSNSYRDISNMDEPRTDYGRYPFEEDVMLRQKDGYGRGPHYTKSMPSDILRRELVGATGDRSSGGYSDRYPPPSPSSTRPGDFGVRRVNSMYK